jgi:hypothetical protein
MLKQVHTSQITFDLLREWFSGEHGAVFTTRYYYAATNYHKDQIKVWRNLGRRKRWKYHLARRLFSIHAAAIDTALALYNNGVNAWMMLNCQPSGGKWLTAAYTTSPTGKHCRSWLCPWCYMREMHYLQKVLLTPAGSAVETVSGHSTESVGLKEPLNVLSLSVYGRSLLEPKLQGKGLYLLFCQKANKVVRQAGVCETDEGPIMSEFPEFSGAALKTMAPVLSADKEPGLRISYVYNGAPLPGEKFRLKLDDGTLVYGHRQTGRTYFQAIQAARPFPLWALAMDRTDPEGLARLVYEGMSGRHKFDHVSI